MRETRRGGPMQVPRLPPLKPPRITDPFRTDSFITDNLHNQGLGLPDHLKFLQRHFVAFLL